MYHKVTPVNLFQSQNTNKIKHFIWLLVSRQLVFRFNLIKTLRNKHQNVAEVTKQYVSTIGNSLDEVTMKKCKRNIVVIWPHLLKKIWHWTSNWNCKNDSKSNIQITSPISWYITKFVLNKDSKMFNCHVGQTDWLSK